MNGRGLTPIVGLVWLLAACGGGEDAPSAGTPVAEPPPPTAAAPVSQDTGSVAATPAPEGGLAAPAATAPQVAEGAATAPAAEDSAMVAAAPDSAQEAGQAAAQGPSTGLARETFAYRGSGRDPFQSLMASGEVRPLFEDLRLTAVMYDARYPARSVAVVRDVSVGKRYDVRVDDQLGRLRVVAIRQTEVVFMLEEFGVERQVSLALRRTQEGIP